MLVKGRFDSDLWRVKVVTPAPFDLLWDYRRREADDLTVIRAAQAAGVWRTYRGIDRWRVASRFLPWPERILKDVLMCFGGPGKRARHAFGRGLRSQLKDIIALRLKLGIGANLYYRNGLARYDGGPTMFRFLPHNPYANAMCYWAHRALPPDVVDVNDKIVFGRQCRNAGIPCPTTLMRLPADDRIDGLDLDGRGEAHLPRTDLFVKPVRGYGGVGAQLWRYETADRYRNAADVTRSTEDLLPALRREACRWPDGILIQKRVRNHPSVAAIMGETLVTARIVTVLDESGVPEVCQVYLRVPVRADAVVDNFHAGAIQFIVDPDSGVIDRGWGGNFAADPHYHHSHPVSRIRLSGRRLEGWEVMRGLALDAHRAFAEYVILGWDVAFAERGPMVIEANFPPGLIYDGISGTRLTSLIAYHLSNTLAKTEPAGSRWRVMDGRPADGGMRKDRRKLP